MDPAALALMATEVIEPNAGAAGAALVAVAAGLVLVAVLAAANRPRRPAVLPASQELGTEPPAVVDLLVGGFDVDDDAIAATLVDLAARRHVEIFDVGGNVVVRVRPPRSDDPLTRYEARVLRQVQRVAGPDGALPAEALTVGPQAVSDRWRRGFVREVTADARARGLCRRRWGLGQLGVVWIVVVVAGALVWLARSLGRASTDVGAYGSPANLAWGLAVVGTVSLFALASRLTKGHAQRDTDAGLAAAAPWTGVRAWYAQGDFAAMSAAAVALWDRHLAYATAMGAAPGVERQLSFAAEHDRTAWSRHGGRYRRVQVRYWSLRPGWGQAPWTAALSGLVQGLVAGAIWVGAVMVARDDVDGLADLDPDTRRWIGLGALALATVLAVVVVWCATKLLLGVLDLFPRRTREGLVVRARHYRRGHRVPRALRWVLSSGRDRSGQRRGDQRRSTYHLAIDDGQGDRLVAHRVRPDRYRQAPQGSIVRVRVSPRLGYVAEVTLVAPPPAQEAPVVHELVERGLDIAGGMAASAGDRLARSFEQLGEMTDEDGRPLLDSTDTDGVPLRTRVAEAQAQLDRLGPVLGALTGRARRGDGRPLIPPAPVSDSPDAAGGPLPPPPPPPPPASPPDDPTVR